MGDISRDGKNRNLRFKGRRRLFWAFVGVESHLWPPFIDVPGVIAGGEVDVLPAERRDMLKQTPGCTALDHQACFPYRTACAQRYLG